LLAAHGLSSAAASVTRGKKAENRHYGAPSRVDPARAVQGFLDWCGEHDVDPIRWTIARHEAVGWEHPIPVSRLKSAKFLPKFRAWGDDHQAAETSQDTTASSIVQGARPQSRWRAARLREMYRGDRQSCWYTATGEGLTWRDPESPECGNCPYAAECPE
jgi:hypothetical protein